MTSTDRNERTPVIVRPRTVGTPVYSRSDDHKMHEIVERALHEITRLSPPKQAAVGGVSGVAAGYCFAKVSKAAAFVIGASVVGLAIANQSGYISINFDRIRDSAQQHLNSAQRIARSALPPTTMTTHVDGDDVEVLVDQSPKTIIDSLKDFALANLSITSSFVGGFLLGIALE